MNTDSGGIIKRTFSIEAQDHAFEIHPVMQEDLQAVLEVYRQCEDFLALVR